MLLRYNGRARYPASGTKEERKPQQEAQSGYERRQKNGMQGLLRADVAHKLWFLQDNRGPGTHQLEVIHDGRHPKRKNRQCEM